MTSLIIKKDQDALAVLPSLDGCRWCGIRRLEHMQRWKAHVGWHEWTPLEQVEIKARMLARRAARLNREPDRYHAKTDWTGTLGDPEDPGEEMCADCRNTHCPRWNRIQRKLERQRRRMAAADQEPGTTASGGWGGDALWPF